MSAGYVPAPAASCPLCWGYRVVPGTAIGGTTRTHVPCPACCPEHYRGRRVVVRGPGGVETVFAGPPPAAERGS